MPKISKSKNLSAGVTKTTKKAPNKEGAFISVQNRTLGNMKKGGKVMRAQNGRSISETRTVSDLSGNKSNVTSGMGNAKIKSMSGDKNYVTKTKTDASGNVTSSKSRRTVKGFLSGAPRVKDNLKKGGSVKKMSKMSKKK